MEGTTSGTLGQGHFRRRTLLRGALGAGALAGLAGGGTASASASRSGGGDCVENGVEPGWGKVADVFRANFEGNPGEVGAACSVYVGGRPVVNLWDGLADRAANRPWRKNTIVQVASTTKGATAICAHMLAQRGELDLDAPVVQYWPEFGANGKDRIQHHVRVSLVAPWITRPSISLRVPGVRQSSRPRTCSRTRDRWHGCMPPR